MEVQERILDTSFGLFRQFGTRSITMDDIAQKMGVSKKTLYAHFADKDELVAHAIERYLQIMHSESLGHQQQASNAIEELFLVMNWLDEHMRNMNPVVMLDLQKFHSRAFQVFQDFRNHSLRHTIRQNLERGMKEGLYRPDLDVEIMTQYRISSAMLCFQPDAFPLGRHEMGKVQRVVMEHFMYGVVTLKGYQLIEQYKQQQLSQNK